MASYAQATTALLLIAATLLASSVAAGPSPENVCIRTSPPDFSVTGACGSRADLHKPADLCARLDPLPEPPAVEPGPCGPQ